MSLIAGLDSPLEHGTGSGAGTWDWNMGLDYLTGTSHVPVENPVQRIETPQGGGSKKNNFKLHLPSLGLPYLSSCLNEHYSHLRMVPVQHLA